MLNCSVIFIFECFRQKSSQLGFVIPRRPESTTWTCLSGGDRNPQLGFVIPVEAGIHYSDLSFRRRPESTTRICHSGEGQNPQLGFVIPRRPESTLRICHSAKAGIHYSDLSFRRRPESTTQICLSGGGRNPGCSRRSRPRHSTSCWRFDILKAEKFAPPLAGERQF